MVWMKVQIDDATDEALRRNAQRLGVSLPEYLRLLAMGDEAGEPPNGGGSDSLRARLHERIAEAQTLVPEPRTPAAGSYADAVVRKYRDQGLHG